MFEYRINIKKMNLKRSEFRLYNKCFYLSFEWNNDFAKKETN